MSLDPIMMALCGGDGTKVEKGWETIIPAVNVPFTLETAEDGRVVGFYDGEDTINSPCAKIKNGDICKVVWDEKEYICTATGDGGEVILGNPEGVADKEPFAIIFFNNGVNLTMSFCAISADPTHNVALYLQHETVTAVGSFPVVELTTVFDPNIELIEVTAEDIAKLEKLLGDGALAFIARLELSGTQITSIFTALDFEGIRGFAAIGIGGGLKAELVIGKADGAWVATAVVF